MLVEEGEYGEELADCRCDDMQCKEQDGLTRRQDVSGVK